MTTRDLLEVLKEGIENGRISPHLAAYIAAEVLGVDPQETDMDDVVQLEEAAVLG
jgi:hypothetical protein